MFEESRRLDHRILGANWVEVISYPDGQSLAVGLLKDISTGGLSFDLPVRLGLDSRVRVRLSGMSSSGLVRHFQFAGENRPRRPAGVRLHARRQVHRYDHSGAERVARLPLPSGYS